MIKERDRDKASNTGFGNLLSAGTGWLGRAFFHRLSMEEIKRLGVYPNACCVGVNAGRLHRERMRRLSKVANHAVKE